MVLCDNKEFLANCKFFVGISSVGYGLKPYLTNAPGNYFTLLEPKLVYKFSTIQNKPGKFAFFGISEYTWWVDFICEMHYGRL